MQNENLFFLDALNGDRPRFEKKIPDFLQVEAGLQLSTLKFLTRLEFSERAATLLNGP